MPQCIKCSKTVWTVSDILKGKGEFILYNKEYINPYIEKKETFLKPIGEKLKDERFARQMSLSDMGELLGVSGIQIMYYEEKNTHIRYNILEKYAEKLDIDIETLIPYCKTIEYKNNKKTGEILKKAREKSKKTMNTVCNELKISFMSLYRYENSENKYIRSDIIEMFERYYSLKKGELLNACIQN